MAITVIMQDSRPDGAGETYKKGSTYSLPDTLATYFIDIGLAKRTSTRSEQTGLQITGDSAGRFPSAPAQDAEDVLKVRRSSDSGLGFSTGVEGLDLMCTLKTDFRPSIVMTLSASATYGQNGNVVTVSCAGHSGINRTSPTGLRFFWPGSVAVPAGWYEQYTYINADSFSFFNPLAQTVAAGTAVVGSAKSAYIPVAGFSFPQAINAEGAMITHEGMYFCDATAAIKFLRTRIGGAIGGYFSFTGANAFGKRDLTTIIRSGRWTSMPASDGTAASNISLVIAAGNSMIELCAYSTSDNACILVDSLKVRYTP